MVSYADIRSDIKSFDILLFSGKGLISRLIQLGSRSKWSHVAVALRLADYDQVLCYESTTLSDIPDLTTGAKVKGVQLVPLSMRIASYDGEIAWRPVEGQRTRKMKQAAAAFMREFAGRPYEENQLELIRSALDVITLRENQPDASSVFCSEMNCLLHRAVGVQVDSGTPANEFTPADFAGDWLPFADGYSAGKLVEIEG